MLPSRIDTRVLSRTRGPVGAVGGTAGFSTEMSDFAAVRIHSKTTSIFSSRPIISRKRCTDGEDSSTPTWSRLCHSKRTSPVSMSSSWTMPCHARPFSEPPTAVRSWGTEL